MHARLPHYSLLVPAFFVASCATKAPPRPVVKAEPALPPPRVEKVREPLEVTPLELHFSGLRGKATASESVAIKNSSNDAAQISDLRVVGTHVATFKIANAPLLPVVLQPGTSFSFDVVFEPAADAEPGVHRARVRIVRSEDDDGPPCDLTGLVSKGTQPADEPPLQQILEALGYDVDVGSQTLTLPPGPALAGDEVKAPRFQRAKPGSVGYYLIASYAADEDSLFGYDLVKGKKAVDHNIGAVAKGHHQTLNPELDGESQTSFDPGEAAFGLYVKIGRRVLYSDSALNAGPHKHAARVYPLRSRGRTPVQDAYVVAFDEDGNGDFQDYVFMLWNVQPAHE